MRENIIRVKSIGYGYREFPNPENKFAGSPIERVLLETMEKCGVDAPLINIYRYDGDLSEFRSNVEESLEAIDKENCVIMTEAYVRANDLESYESNKNQDSNQIVNNVLKEKSAILKSLGFIDISFYSEYYSGIPFLYKNKLSDKIYEFMHNESLDKNLYGILIKLNMKDKDHIRLIGRCIGEQESESFYSKNSTEIDIDDSIYEKKVLEDNEHVKLELSYVKLSDMQRKDSNMIPASRTRSELNINDIKPGTLSLYITDKLDNNQITNIILLDLCDTNIMIHWRRFTELSEHTVASTNFSVVNLIKSELYWNESGVFNLVFRIPDPKSISKPIFTYLLPEDTDFSCIDLWQSKYIRDMIDKAIYLSKGIYCETLVDEEMMKHYTFRDMLTGDITYQEVKPLNNSKQN